MANLIDTVVVNGTEYELVGRGGEYPIAVFEHEPKASDFPGETLYVSETITPSFSMLRFERDGKYSYQLAIDLGDDPSSFTYAQASEC